MAQPCGHPVNSMFSENGHQSHSLKSNDQARNNYGLQILYYAGVVMSDKISDGATRRCRKKILSTSSIFLSIHALYTKHINKHKPWIEKHLSFSSLKVFLSANDWRRIHSFILKQVLHQLHQVLVLVSLIATPHWLDQVHQLIFWQKGERLLHLFWHEIAQGEKDTHWSPLYGLGCHEWCKSLLVHCDQLHKRRKSSAN